MIVVEETFCQLLQKVWFLWCKQIFVYLDEDFAINWIRPKFLSILLTGKIRVGVTEMSSLKSIRKWCISSYSKVVHNINCCLHTQNLPCIYRINFKQANLQEQRLGFRMTCHFSLMHVLWNERFWDDPTSLTHERIRRDFHYIWTSHPSL